MADLTRSPIRVFLAEEQGIFRESFSAGLRGTRNITLVGVSTKVDISMLERAIALDELDVMVLGMKGPDPTLTRWLGEVRSDRPDIGTVLLASAPVPEAMNAVKGPIGPGGRGYAALLKQNLNSAEDLAHTIQAVADGRVVVDPALFESMLAPASKASSLPKFSSREVEVLELMSAGYRNKAIATELSITTKTVERHIQSIYSKLGHPPEAIQPRAYAIAAFQGQVPAEPLPA
jgi:DNA-binding NarL/FixJ family response regulator